VSFIKFHHYIIIFSTSKEKDNTVFLTKIASHLKRVTDELENSGIASVLDNNMDELEWFFSVAWNMG